MSNWDFSSFLDEALRQIKEDFEQQGRIQEYALWFSLEYESSTENVITVSVPSSFVRDQFKQKGYAEETEQKLFDLSGKELSLNFIIKPKKREKQTVPSQAVPQAARIQPQTQSYSGQPQHSRAAVYENPIENTYSSNQTYVQSQDEKQKNTGLNSDYTFERFVPGENNNFAYNVAVAVSNNPGTTYNPVLFYGGVGLGKTHLMEAIGNAVYKNTQGKLKIIYISAENFTNEFVQAIRTSSNNSKDRNSMVNFKLKYRNADILLIDDIHFLQNKEETQEELFHTFNALYESKKQLVFTCDRPIHELKNITARLKSRFDRGVSVDMQPPAYETRRAILEKKLSLMNRTLPEDIIDLIAQNVCTNVRDLEASLIKLTAYIDLTQIAHKKITVEKAQELLKDTFRSPPNEKITVETIQRVVADAYNISYTDMKGKKKTRPIVFPRQIAMYITREMTDLSTTDIGMEFGGRDHTTVMHACNQIKEQQNADPFLNYKIQNLMQEIKMYKKN